MTQKKYTLDSSKAGKNGESKENPSKTVDSSTKGSQNEKTGKILLSLCRSTITFLKTFILNATDGFSRFHLILQKSLIVIFIAFF